jgi:hypothetical protein
VTEPKTESFPHSVVTEPKFCTCRLCHEYFYADPIATARSAFLAHGERFHPDWARHPALQPGMTRRVKHDARK